MEGIAFETDFQTLIVGLVPSGAEERKFEFEIRTVLGAEPRED